MTLVIPARLDTLAGVRLVEEMNAISPGETVSVDVRRISILEPFAMLFVSSGARISRARGVLFDVPNSARHSYAAHIGLLAEFDPLYSSIASEPPNGENYIAIRSITTQELQSEANEISAAYLGDVIERQSVRIARLLTRCEKSELVNALTYCLREIIRNSFEHSGAVEVSLCGQYRQSSDRVDVAFADHGMGIRASLSRNPRVSVSSELDAIKVALLPGISGTGGRRPRGRAGSENPWSNSGYGLYMTQRICRDGGTFTICSGNSLVRLTQGNEIERTITPVGTVVGLNIQLDRLRDLEKKLAQFQAEGAVISRMLKGAEVNASLASLSLRMTIDKSAGAK